MSTRKNVKTNNNVKLIIESDNEDNDNLKDDKEDDDLTNENEINFSDDSDVSSLVPSDLPQEPNPTNETQTIKKNGKKIMKTIEPCKENMYSKECNDFLLKNEEKERNESKKHLDSYKYLYPTLNDANFNIKIAEKKEFNIKYDGTIYENIKEQADIIAKSDFELSPHQEFVKNYLSFQTPYNSLLLFHGLGTGKTCSAIGVCEEMRDYMKQTGKIKKIIIVASDNVQNNFRLQLFDERNLKSTNDVWTTKGCVGNKLLKEVNPTSLLDISKETIVKQINNLIRSNYVFMGYEEFANYIFNTASLEKINNKQIINDINDVDERNISRIQNEFNERLIVIDEIHNIRQIEGNENKKKIAQNLEFLAKTSQNIRFLFLSATPMYNNYKEIVWLLNIMNMNDKRGRIKIKDIFDDNGNFVKNGKELLMRKATGYVSFVRGENPYTFPYRVYPNEFAKENTFPFIKYPSYQLNLKKIEKDKRNRILNLFLLKIGNCNDCGDCQYCAYKYIIYYLRNKNNKVAANGMPSFENMESFGYTMLETPIESLIISYPHDKLKSIISQIPKPKYSKTNKHKHKHTGGKNGVNGEEFNIHIDEQLEDEQLEDEQLEDEQLEDEQLEDEQLEDEKLEEEELEDMDVEEQKSKAITISKKINIGELNSDELTGRKGLSRIMKYKDKGDFEYKNVKKYGRIFQTENIGKYSSKIKNILDSIVLNKNENTMAEGIILIFSQYIEGGLIPVALALEELGFTRFDNKAKNLFKDRPTKAKLGKYAMITGDAKLSPNNSFELKNLTNIDNVNGEKIKVVLISRAGSEGIDFKYIRQVHILDPWYNMNRIEQVIGRAVRNLSHIDLPFEKRNVQIFMYATILGKEEAADLYVFRLAEYKAIQIGKVTRVLKECAVDCIINHAQTNFTQENISAKLNGTKIKQELSTGMVLDDFKIGDVPFSPACDYMDNCNYKCTPNKKIKDKNINEGTYNEFFINIHSDKIIQKIRSLMKERFFYTKNALFNAIRIPKPYSYIQIYSALTTLIENNNEFIEDKYGRIGRLVNIGEYYLYQPIEINDKHISIYDRSVPIDYKHKMIEFKLNDDAVYPAVVDKRFLNKKQDQEDTDENVKNREIVDQTEEKEENVKEQEQIEQTELPSKRSKAKPEAFKNMKSMFEEVKEIVSNNNIIINGKDEWHNHCGVAIQKLLNNSVLDNPMFNEMKTEENLYMYLVSHMIETLLYKDKLALINYIYSLKQIESTESLEYLIKKYFQDITLEVRSKKFILFYDYTKKSDLNITMDNVEDMQKLLIFNNKSSKWELSKAVDVDDFNDSSNLKFEKSEYNEIIGFIGYTKNTNYLVFKTKNMNSQRDTGARCDEKGKGKTIELFNEIVGSDIFTKANTTKIVSQELCVYEEFVLRFFNENKRNGKKWFITPEMAIEFFLKENKKMKHKHKNKKTVI